MRVVLFARLRDAVGADMVDIEPCPTVGGLRCVLMNHWPHLAALIAKSAIAVNDAYASDETPIEPTAEVAVIPPVSGG